MAYCVSCGVRIPDGQRTCSVCYGDPDHGRDGILRRMMEEEYQQYCEQQEEERRQEEQWQQEQ